MKGRKRHILVDSNGLLLQVQVQPANVQERTGARWLLEQLHFPAQRMQCLWADAGYWGDNFPQWVQERWGWQVQIVSKVADGVVNRKGQPKGYVPLPRRWVVERTFAWLGRWRRLSKDYEQNPCSSVAWIYVAMIGLMIKRLA